VRIRANKDDGIEEASVSLALEILDRRLLTMEEAA